jgi:phosphopantothenoylcysteine decarboxylase/phosphopantothenate--cysteine ligase
MKILITAGATWVKLDEVRIFTNRFSGGTGLYLAKSLKKKGHSITLLINPHCLEPIKGLNCLYYRYFYEFKDKVVKLLKNHNYAAIIHTAAVSDYKLKTAYKGKISSGRKNLSLKLIPAEKIINQIRRLAKKAILVQFKLEVKNKGIVDKAYQSLKANKSDFVVANSLEDISRSYKAWLIDNKKKALKIGSKKALADVLNRIIIK